MPPLEIERKWVMKGIPDFTPDQTLAIFQFYTDEARFRSATDVQTNIITYFKTVKKYVSPGVNEEVEKVIESKLFFSQMPLAKKALNKIRRVYAFTDFKVEIDVVPHKKDLVLMEIELKSMDQEIELVEWIKKLIVKEVTGKAAYNNSKLAVKI